MLLCLPSILTSKTVFLMWWWLETGCWGGNLVKWGCEGEVLMRELMFSYKKRGNKAILPWTCEDIGRRSQSMSLGFTGSASQTMRCKCILCPVGGIFFQQPGMINTVTLTSMSFSDVEPLMPFMFFLHFQRMKREKESRVSPSCASHPSFWGMPSFELSIEFIWDRENVMYFLSLPYPGTELALQNWEWGINYIQSLWLTYLFAYRAKMKRAGSWETVCSPVLKWDCEKSRDVGFNSYPLVYYYDFNGK